MVPLEDRPSGDGRPDQHKDSWQGNGRLSVGSLSESQSFQVNFKKSGYYTVQFDVQTPSNAPANQIILPRAEILWSVEGTFVRRLVNLARGNAISGAGQGVKVRMFDYSTLVGATPIEYFVSAQVTLGTRPNGSSSKPPVLESGPQALDPRGTISLQTLPGPSVGTWFIPPNAGVVSAYVVAAPVNSNEVTPINNNDFQINQRVLSGGTLLSTSNYDQFGVWIPVSPSCGALEVSNKTAIDYNVSVLWGVEG